MKRRRSDIELVKQGLTTLFPALAALAKVGFLSDTFTVGSICPEGGETEVCALDVLELGMYRLSEAQPVLDIKSASTLSRHTECVNWTTLYYHPPSGGSTDLEWRTLG